MEPSMRQNPYMSGESKIPMIFLQCDEIGFKFKRPIASHFGDP